MRGLRSKNFCLLLNLQTLTYFCGLGNTHHMLFGGECVWSGFCLTRTWNYINHCCPAGSPWALWGPQRVNPWPLGSPKPLLPPHCSSCCCSWGVQAPSPFSGFHFLALPQGCRAGQHSWVQPAVWQCSGGSHCQGACRRSWGPTQRQRWRGTCSQSGEGGAGSPAYAAPSS